MPDHVIAADLDILERMLCCLADMRAAGQFSPLHDQALEASQMLSGLSDVAPAAHRARIGKLAHRYQCFLRSVAH